MNLKRKLIDWLASDVVREIRKETRDKTLSGAHIDFTIEALGMSQQKNGLYVDDELWLSHHRGLLGAEKSISDFRVKIDAVKSSYKLDD
jgi:hypothetical protein